MEATVQNYALTNVLYSPNHSGVHLDGLMKSIGLGHKGVNAAGGSGSHQTQNVYLDLRGKSPVESGGGKNYMDTYIDKTRLTHMCFLLKDEQPDTFNTWRKNQDQSIQPRSRGRIPWQCLPVWVVGSVG